MSWLDYIILPEQIFVRRRTIGEGHTPCTAKPIVLLMAERCLAPLGLAETGRLIDRPAWP
jgi:hypothetical protein